MLTYILHKYADLSWCAMYAMHATGNISSKVSLLEWKDNSNSNTTCVTMKPVVDPGGWHKRNCSFCKNKS